MPIYAYRCAACGHAKDVLQKLSDPLLTTCPVCGAEAFSKQVTAAGFQLKGSGWYATDFKGGGAKPASKAADIDLGNISTPQCEFLPLVRGTLPDSACPLDSYQRRSRKNARRKRQTGNILGEMLTPVREAARRIRAGLPTSGL